MGVRPDAWWQTAREDPSVSASTLASRRWVRARAPLALRVRVWWAAGPLDRRLAQGTPPSRSDTLALRAAQLTNRQAQARLAADLDWIVNRASSGYREPRLAAVPLQRASIRSGADELRALANALRFSPRRVPRAAAIASYLLHDGCSPFYNEHATASPATLARAATSALPPPDPDAAWQCLGTDAPPDDPGWPDPRSAAPTGLFRAPGRRRGSQ